MVFVVDFETEPGALVGLLITKMTKEQVMANANPHFGYVTIPLCAYYYGPVAVRQAMYDQEARVATSISSNATSLLRLLLSKITHLSIP